MRFSVLDLVGGVGPTTLAAPTTVVAVPGNRPMDDRMAYLRICLFPMTDFTKNLTLGEFSISFLWGPCPNIVGNLTFWINVIKLKFFPRATSHTRTVLSKP